MLLPEPFPSFPSKQISIDGLKYISVIFEETIPIIPWCHPSFPTIMHALSFSFSSIIFTASSYICFSIDCLSILYSFNLTANFFASFLSLHKNKSNASFSLPILPHAFILGAIPNETELESIFLNPIISIKALKPIFLVWATNLSPSFAITLFSSTNGTISEIVPIHTMSKYFKYSFSSKPNLIDNACITLKTTPTPASWLKGYSLSFLLASTTAIAFGKLSAGSWWSVIIISIPSEFAYSTSSIPEIPQSTVTISLKPSS